MARRTKRRRPRVAWFPTFGGAPVPEGTSAPWAGIESEINFDSLTPEDQVNFDAVPLTFDITEGAVQSQAAPTDRTLRDIVQGNEWRFRRLVGKAFIHVSSGVQGATVSPVMDVALGFIVCKTYDDGSPWTDFSEVNPLSQESMEDPWIWRRRWLLHPYGETNYLKVTQSPATQDFRNSPGYWGWPSTTAGYGSVMDGPHIDAKSNRVIHRSERLFAVLAARRYSFDNATVFQDTQVKMLLDYRLLGSLRGTSYGNRGNMSR